jgi:hypothetical protein
MECNIVSWGANTSRFDDFSDSDQQNNFSFEIEFDIVSNESDEVLQYYFLYADMAGLSTYVKHNSFESIFFLKNCLVVNQFSLKELEYYIWNVLNLEINQKKSWKDLLLFLNSNFTVID